MVGVKKTGTHFVPLKADKVLFHSDLWIAGALGSERAIVDYDRELHDALF